MHLKTICFFGTPKNHLFAGNDNYNNNNKKMVPKNGKKNKYINMREKEVNES